MSQEHKDLLQEIETMSQEIGVAKQARLKAVVNHAFREGKLDKVNLQDLAALPVKKIHLEKMNL